MRVNSHRLHHSTRLRPTEKAFTEGSYETINSRIAPGGGKRLVTEAVRLLKALAVP